MRGWKMDLGWNLDQLLRFHMKGEPIFRRDCQLYVLVLNEKTLVLTDPESWSFLYTRGTVHWNGFHASVLFPEFIPLISSTARLTHSRLLPKNFATTYIPPFDFFFTLYQIGCEGSFQTILVSFSRKKMTLWPSKHCALLPLSLYADESHCPGSPGISALSFPLKHMHCSWNGPLRMQV